MIDQNEIEAKVKTVLTGSGLFPLIAWANRDFPQVRPYLAVAVVPSFVDDETLAQNLPVWWGFIVLTAVTELNKFETPGKTLLKQAGDLFPAGVRLTMTSGKKLLPGHPNPLPPYRDGSDFRLPMRIKIQTEG